ncbi:MAG: ferredoxin reductase family protein [Rhodospirillales bacterium]|jgi:predicted ferric reductase
MNALTMITNHRPGLNPVIIIVGYFIIVLAPLGLAISTGRTGRGLIKDFAHAIGMIAYAMMLAQFILSNRFETLSGNVGIDVLMRFHQLAARTLTVLIILHPILMTGRVAVRDLGDAPDYLFSLIQDPRNLTGMIAFGLLIILIVTSLGRRHFKIPYEFWRAIHGVSALGVAGFGWHHATTIGRYSKNSPLVEYWTVLFALALVALMYIYFIKPLLLLRRPYRVLSNDKVGNQLWEVTLKPEGNHRLHYAPGQFAWVNFRHQPISFLDHPFSISSSPSKDKNVSFIIQEDGDFTNGIGSIAKGHIAFLDAPHGNFTLAGRHGTAIGLIAGGVGIAPMLSILRDLNALNDSRPIRLIYGAKTEDKLVGVADIEMMKQSIDLQTRYVLDTPPDNWPGETGVISESIVHACFDFPQPATALYFLCGPPNMMESAEKTLLEMGLPLSQIVYERFTFD